MRKIFQSQISSKNPSIASQVVLFPAGGETDERTDMKKITFVLRNFANALRTNNFILCRELSIFPPSHLYGGADKSLARPTSRCILFDGENISFDASLVIYINSTNIPPIMIINKICETQNLLSL